MGRLIWGAALCIESNGDKDSLDHRRARTQSLVVTHRPDVPITLGDSMRIGFCLWNYPVLAVIMEMLIFAAGIWLYAAHTEARDRVGSIGAWALDTEGRAAGVITGAGSR